MQPIPGSPYGLLADVFWFINFIVSLLAISAAAKARTPSGTPALATPASWVWIWQMAGALVIALAGLNPWHLIWWFPVGAMVSIVVGRILFLAGLIRP